MFGLTIDKLMLIGVIAAFIIGPGRLPAYAAKLAQLVRWTRQFVRTMSTRVKDELGEDFEDIDWKKLDPRQYDPRNIIRSALLDETEDPVSISNKSAEGVVDPNPLDDTAKVEAHPTPARDQAPKRSPVSPKSI